MTTRIERHWNKELLKNWLSIVFITLILYSFFQAIREVRLLSDSYHVMDLLIYLAFEAMIFTIELFPITLFIAGMNLQDEWKKKDYYLNALLDGVTLESWRKLSMRNAIIILCLWMPIWFFILPHYSYSSSIARLEHLNRIPKINSDKIYMISGHTLAYIESANDNEKILNLSTQTIHALSDYKDVITKWKQRFMDFKVGIDKKFFLEKIYYWKESFGKDRALLISSFMRDIMYMVSIPLCWIFISIDREYKMFSTKRDEENPHWAKRVIQISILYWGTKIMPLLARFFYPSGLVLGYFCALTLSFII